MAELLNKIQIKNLGMAFESNAFIFEGLTQSLQESGTWEFCSDQGLGKSLLLQVLGGITPPSHGKVYYNEMDVYGSDFQKILPLRLQIGYAFDLGGLLHNRTIFENLILPMQYHKLYNPSKRQEIVEVNLAKFQIAKYRDLRPSFVSGSVRKMTVLIRSLLLKPRFLILDDPFVGLSEFQKAALINEIESLRSASGFLSVILTDSVPCTSLNRDGYYVLNSASMTHTIFQECAKVRA